MNLKVWAYLGIVIAVLGGMKFGYSAIYRAGFNAAVVEQERLIADAKVDAHAREREFWQGVVKRAEENIRTEEIIVETIKEVEKRIPVVVDNLVEVAPDCSDLGPVVGVLNDQVRAGRSGEGDSTGNPAVTD